MHFTVFICILSIFCLVDIKLSSSFGLLNKSEFINLKCSSSAMRF